REDSRAQRGFAERGLALEPVGEVDLRLRLHDAEALTRLGDYRHANKLAAQLVTDAAAAGMRDIQGRALYLKGISSWITSETADVQASLEELRRAKGLLAEFGDWTFVTLAVEN